jgi:UPF0716 family protein affecting phage T7 exclusion
VSHTVGGWYLIAVGSATALVGLVLWSPAAVVQRSRIGRFALALATVALGHAPDSWVPWGLAFIVAGIGLIAGPPVVDALGVLALLAMVVGVPFVVRPPSWAQGRAIHVYLRELGIERPGGRRRRDV